LNKIVVPILLAIIFGASDFRSSFGESNNTSIGKSMVDNLIEETKRNQAVADSYRAELLDRIINSTCFDTTVSSIGALGSIESEVGKRDVIKSMITSFNMSQLEELMKYCATESYGNIESMIGHEFDKPIESAMKHFDDLTK